MLPKISSQTEWRPLTVGDNRYAVSEYGHVINIQAWDDYDADGRVLRWLGHQLSPQPDRAGYVKYFFEAKEGRTSAMAHSLVYRAFIGELPPNKEIDHIDNNKWNNHYSNLQPLTHKENQEKASRERRFHPPKGSLTWDGRRNKIAKLVEADIPRIRELYENGYTHREIAKEYGVSHVCIVHICQRRTWRHVD